MTDTYQLPEEELEAVRALAYLKFEARGCTDGYHLEDWLAAEQEVRVNGSLWDESIETLEIQTSEVRPPSASKSRGRAVSVSKRTKK